MYKAGKKAKDTEITGRWFSLKHGLFSVLLCSDPVLDTWIPQILEELGSKPFLGCVLKLISSSLCLIKVEIWFSMLQTVERNVSQVYIMLRRGIRKFKVGMRTWDLYCNFSGCDNHMPGACILILLLSV